MALMACSTPALPFIKGWAHNVTPERPESPSCAADGPAVIVLPTLDISFFETVAPLHLNQDQIAGAGGEPMHRAHRDEQGDARPGRDGFPLQFKPTVAGHHHPVLTAVAMTLEADALVGQHQQPFHPVGLTIGKGLEPSPGALASP